MEYIGYNSELSVYFFNVTSAGALHSVPWPFCNEATVT